MFTLALFRMVPTTGEKKPPVPAVFWDCADSVTQTQPVPPWTGFLK
jgi:hypothetical protein